jgi:parallel beta-helix repeat protein
MKRFIIFVAFATAFSIPAQNVVAQRPHSLPEKPLEHSGPRNFMDVMDPPVPGYYVDQTNGNDSNDGLTPAYAIKTIEELETITLVPGDSVFFKRGETWREQLSIGYSGTSGAPITFGAYGTGATPVITGADSVSAWTAEGGDVYSETASRTTEPNYVWFDHSLGTKEVSQVALNQDDEWFWDSGTDTLYVFSSTDPAGTVIEPGNRDYALVSWAGTSYYTVDGLEFQKNNSTWAGAVLAVGTTSESQGVTVQNCTFRYIPKAISIYSVNNVVVSDNVITGHGAGTVSGIDFNDGGVPYNAATTVTVSGNTISQVAYGVVSPNTGTEHINAATISNNTISDCAREGLSFNLADGMTVESNIVSNCGGAGDYSGIHFWEVANAIVRYNTVSGQRDSGAVGGNGIQIDTNTDAAEVYYNLVYDSDGAGISVIDAAGVLIYNNTLYDNGQNNSLVDGVYLAGPSLDTTSATIKNNIGYATNNYAIYIDSNTSDNSLEFDANLWYKAAGNWWYDGSTGGDSLDAWNLKSYVTDDLEGDPVFVSSSDFQLATGSPAIDAGVRIGFGTDILGNPIVGDPDMGAYEVQP